jgi:Zn finger protein HypA/HybF involved in hydrogenase expression
MVNEAIDAHTKQMKFPLLHCRCPNLHGWAMLIPTHWFSLANMECPHCGSPAAEMKAGDWKTLDQIKEAQANSSCTLSKEDQTAQKP